MKKNLPLILLNGLLLTLLISCSAVFTASVTGIVADEDDWEEDPDNAGISNVIVLLYDNEANREADSLAFTESTELDPTDSMELYLQKTVTEDDGTFQINGVIWENQEPIFGKDGDIKTVYILAYHRYYGLVEREARLVSNVTNRNLLIKIPKIMNIIPELTGSLLNIEDETPLNGINVTLYIPQSWEYSGNDPVNFVWDYDTGIWQMNVTSNAEGEFSFADVSFPMIPSSSENKGTTRFKLEFDANNYFFDTTVDSHLTKDSGDDPTTTASADATDFDSDGIADPYYLTGIFEEGLRQNLAYDIYGRSNENTIPELSGTLLNDEDNAPLEGVNVTLYIPKSWEYSGSDLVNFVWDYENGTLQMDVTSDADGVFTFNDINYPMMPSMAENKGTVRFKLEFDAADYHFDPTVDSRFTKDSGDDPTTSTADDATDFDSDGTADSYFLTDVLSEGEQQTLPADLLGTDNENRCSVQGKLVEATDRNTVVSQVTVSLYLARNWTYKSDDTSGTSFDTIEWDEEPSYTGTTDDEGIFSFDTTYKMLPSIDGNKGTVPARLFIEKDGYEVNWVYTSADDAATDEDSDTEDGKTQKKVSNIDHDNSSSTATQVWTLSDGSLIANAVFTDINADNENDVYRSLVLKNDSTIRLDLDEEDHIGIKCSRFSVDLSGRIALDADSDDDLSDGNDGYKNNKEVWVYLNKDTISDSLLNGLAPDYTAVTSSKQIGSSNSAEEGWFDISGINWVDTHYTGRYSKINIAVYVPDSGDLAVGYMDTVTTGNGMIYHLKSDNENSVELYYLTN